MDDSHITSIAQIQEFTKVARDISFQGSSQKEKYQWIEEILSRFRYFSLKKKERSILKAYMRKMTGYSDAQTTRLLAKKKRSGKILANTRKRHRFPRIYTSEDVARLTETDNAHNRLSGPATKKILEREWNVFKKEEFRRISEISQSHIYNLRATRQYQSHALTVRKTTSTNVPIGERRKPDSQGKPGYIRVDTVHQGDLEKEKGVYHINMVDELIQWEVVGCVEKISEFYLAPLLEDLIEQYPFHILGFHSDNGSEYINKVVAQLLNKLLIRQTKSRARHCNDNALVEGKNGSVIRKTMGRMHIAQKHATAINQFYKNHLNVYLNYHRPCGFATTITDKKGKQKKVYDTYLIPYEKLRSLENTKQYLKRTITFKVLDEIAYRESDNECGKRMQQAKAELFTNFNQKPRFPTTFATFISGSYVD